MAYLNHNILILLLASIYMVGIIHGMKNITSGPGDYYKNINPDGGDLKAQLQPLLLMLVQLHKPFWISLIVNPFLCT